MFLCNSKVSASWARQIKAMCRHWIPVMVLAIPLVLTSAIAQQTQDTPESQPAQLQEDLVMNFRAVDIRQIIESVGEVLQKNFLIDPRVRAKVTIIANEPVPKSALYDVLLSILRMHGYRAVESMGIIRIVPANLGARYSTNDVAENLITEIVSIKHLNSASVIPLIKPLMTPQAQVLNHKQTNKLIISETKANLQRAKSVLAKLDIPSVADYDIIPLEYLDAKTMQKILQRVSNKNLRHLAEIIADQDANRIIITGPEEIRLRLRLIIADMDTSEASSHLSGSIRIVSLHYSKAEDMATLLKNLFSSSAFLKNLGGQGIASVSSKQPAPKAAPKPKAPAGKKQPIKPKTGAQPQARINDARNYTIQYDEETNSIIVGGPPKIIDAAMYIIRKLDVPRPQVLIEAIIADISADQMAEIGNTLSNRDAQGNAVITRNLYTGLLAELSGGKINIGGAIRTGGASFRYLIEALNSEENTNVLSTPSILTLNNEEAMIDVSDTRYVQTGSTSAGGGTTTSRNKEEFGTLLKVTPQITEGKAVKLELEQKTEDITKDGNETVDGFPQTRKRELKTSVVVNNGDILVLGGLIKNRRSESKRGVPFLSDIPVLGRLFSDSNSSSNRDTLMIFIRPTILRDSDESFDLSKEVYAQIRLEQLIYGEEIKSLLRDTENMQVKEQATLPDLDTMKGKNVSRGGGILVQSQEATEKAPLAEAANKPPQRKIIRRVIRRRVTEGEG